jgi:hypothetical protein
MKEIQLTQQGKNKGLYTTLVDDDMFEYLNQWRWCVRITKHTSYAYRKNHLRKTEHMHRVIMNTPANMQVDHIDHNGLNNQKINLRNCTKAQNNRNKISKGISKYLGVDRHKDQNKYRSRICNNGIKIHIGNFKSEIDAAKAYDIKAKELFGEFANLNFK